MRIAAAANPAILFDRPIRVMVVDDAIVARRLLTRWIDAEPDMKVAATLRTGREAVDQIEQSAPDVVVLDVDMPELDGIAALPLLLKKKRDLVVIMASALTRRSAEVSLRALSLGAADYVPKPEAAPDAAKSAAFRRELIEKIRHLGRRGRFVAQPWAQASAARLLRRQVGRPTLAMPAPATPAQPEAATFQLRPFSPTPPRVLLLGSSTGGPQALAALIERLAVVIDRGPLLIAQHMPAPFTTVLAEHLSRTASRGAREGEDGEPVLAGGVYVAPGGRHMRVVRRRDGFRIALGDDPPINFCKPSVDALFSSAAAAWGASVLAVVLTGMGSDGTQGGRDIVAAGGSVIAQDEETSVVWGMPRSVAKAGLCSAVLSLDLIAEKIIRLFSGERS